MAEQIIIRKARKKDLPQILSLIKELAAFEKAPKEVKVTLQELARDGFGKKKVYDCFIAEQVRSQEIGVRRKRKSVNSEPPTQNFILGIALYYIKYSTWKGRCIYLDDIIVTESLRGKGIGKKLFEEVIKVAKKMKVRKLEWQVLNWNEPAINFYKKYSTVFDYEWINCKLVFE